jgi:hypothetical protein
MVVGRLLLACVIAIANFCSADAADDPRSAPRTRPERIQSLRKERPSDGALVLYEAITRIELGEREAVFALLRSLQGRKLGLVPVRNAGFEEVWDDPEFQKIRAKLAQEESRTPDAQVAIAADAICVIANSYVGHFEPNGSIKDSRQLKPTAIISVPLKPLP